MFRATIIRSAQEARKPMIRFPDRKNASKEPHEPHPHPAAPKEIAQDFKHFQEVFQSGPHFDPSKIQASSPSSSSSSNNSASSQAGGDVAEDLHDLPRRFWQTPSLLIEQKEIDAINSGGATLVQK